MSVSINDAEATLLAGPWQAAKDHNQSLFDKAMAEFNATADQTQHGKKDHPTDRVVLDDVAARELLDLAANGGASERITVRLPGSGDVFDIDVSSDGSVKFDKRHDKAARHRAEATDAAGLAGTGEIQTDYAQLLGRQPTSDDLAGFIAAHIQAVTNPASTAAPIVAKGEDGQVLSTGNAAEQLASLAQDVVANNGATPGYRVNGETTGPLLNANQAAGYLFQLCLEQGVVNQGVVDAYNAITRTMTQIDQPMLAAADHWQRQAKADASSFGEYSTRVREDNEAAKLALEIAAQPEDKRGAMSERLKLGGHQVEITIAQSSTDITGGARFHDIPNISVGKLIDQVATVLADVAAWLYPPAGVPLAIAMNAANAGMAFAKGQILGGVLDLGAAASFGLGGFASGVDGLNAADIGLTAGKTGTAAMLGSAIGGATAAVGGGEIAIAAIRNHDPLGAAAGILSAIAGTAGTAAAGESASSALSRIATGTGELGTAASIADAIKNKQFLNAGLSTFGAVGSMLGQYYASEQSAEANADSPDQSNGAVPSAQSGSDTTTGSDPGATQAGNNQDPTQNGQPDGSAGSGATIGASLRTGNGSGTDLDTTGKHWELVENGAPHTQDASGQYAIIGKDGSFHFKDGAILQYGSNGKPALSVGWVDGQNAGAVDYSNRPIYRLVDNPPPPPLLSWSNAASAGETVGGFVPVLGQAIAFKDMAEDLYHRRWGGATLDAVSLFPLGKASILGVKAAAAFAKIAKVEKFGATAEANIARMEGNGGGRAFESGESGASRLNGETGKPIEPSGTGEGGQIVHAAADEPIKPDDEIVRKAVGSDITPTAQSGGRDIKAAEPENQSNVVRMERNDGERPSKTEQGSSDQVNSGNISKDGEEKSAVKSQNEDTKDTLRTTEDDQKQLDYKNFKEKTTEILPSAGKLSGHPTHIPKNSSATHKKSLIKENETAITLSNNGFDIEQNHSFTEEEEKYHDIREGAEPDYLIDGVVYDCYSPDTKSIKNVSSNMKQKIDRKQTKRIVLNLDRSSFNPIDIFKNLSEHPIPGLKDVLIVKDDLVTRFTSKE